MTEEEIVEITCQIISECLKDGLVFSSQELQGLRQQLRAGQTEWPLISPDCRKVGTLTVENGRCVRKEDDMGP